MLLLASLIHPDLLTNPLERFTLMNERGNYFHPFLYSFAAYILVILGRSLFRAFTKIFKHITHKTL